VWWKEGQEENRKSGGQEQVQAVVSLLKVAVINLDRRRGKGTSAGDLADAGRVRADDGRARARRAGFGPGAGEPSRAKMTSPARLSTTKMTGMR
jgi:hypothetical protein